LVADFLAMRKREFIGPFVARPSPAYVAALARRAAGVGNFRLVIAYSKNAARRKKYLETAFR